MTRERQPHKLKPTFAWAIDLSEMNIFISYSYHDQKKVNQIIKRLEKDGHEVWNDVKKYAVGENLFERIEQGLFAADIFIVVISENSARSERVQTEFSTIALQNITGEKRSIVPVQIDDFSIPAYFSYGIFFDLSKEFEVGLDFLSAALLGLDKGKGKAEMVGSIEIPTVSKDKELLDTHTSKLRGALRRGELTLVCGAGTSVAAGIPDWGSLIESLIESIIKTLNEENSLRLDEKSVEEFQERFKISSLIVGKYLKNILGDSFSQKVREAIYKSNPRNSPLIDSIVELARPQRGSRSLDSIITFNFDGLIEENLDLKGIPNKAVYSESTRHEVNELPVYHVHGYLPRSGKIPKGSSLVFSEDAYHSQFIEPFSWSNLIQLYKLTQNTCLFVGISLTDPNMRRLLDVASRKNIEGNIGHYIIKRRLGSGRKGKVDQAIEIIEERDANLLGLNVIWLDDYSALPSFLAKIAVG